MSRLPLAPLWLRLALLLAVCAYAVLNEIAPRPALAPLAGALLLLWLLLEAPLLAPVAGLTAAAAGLLVLLSWRQGGLSPDLLARAVGRGAFFAWFILSMDLLRTAALQSRMVRACGRALVDQPPGRRYLMLTLGSHLFSLLLNLGAMTLLGAMIRSATAPAAVDPRLAEIRLRRTGLAIMRGFAAATLWLPTSITVQVVLAAIPGYGWQDFAVQGAATAACFLATGWLLDRLGHPPPPPRPAATPTRSALAQLAPMGLLTLGILIAVAGVAALSGLRPIAALLCVMPCVGLGWMALQRRRAGPARVPLLWLRQLRRRVLPDLATLRSEVTILASAGIIAVLLPHQLDTQALAALVLENHLSATMLLVPLVWIVALTAPLGLSPIVTVAASLELLVHLPGVDIAPGALAFAGTVGWCLGTGLSPLGATVRIMARAIARPAAQIGPVWNRSFTLWIGLAATAVLIAIT